MRPITSIWWAAAIIEGEGCIIVSSSGCRRGTSYPVRQLRLAVEMTDLDILIRLRDILGPYATLRERRPPSLNPRHRRRYILTLTGSELAGWLMTIYPIMGERRQAKIREALSMWKSMRSSWRHSKPRVTHLRVAV